MSIILYSYFRSSAAYRVRIALNLKNIHYEIRPVHLLKNGGGQFNADYLRLNPQGRVPTLVVDNTVLTQSSAIIEYLEETYPNPPLLPAKPIDRAYVRSLAQVIACDIHPLNNLRVLNYLRTSFKDSFEQAWRIHWVHEGFNALEELLKKKDSRSRFCFSDTPGLADAFLIPQVYNALRYQLEMKGFPLISRIYENCMQEPAFSNASPENQPDSEL